MARGTMVRWLGGYTNITQTSCLAFRDWLEATYPSLVRLDTSYKTLDGFIVAHVDYKQGEISVRAKVADQTCAITLRVERIVPASMTLLQPELKTRLGLVNTSPVCWHVDETEDGEDV